MPFTPTHVLAIVPLARCCGWLPFSALAIGCMIPDLPLFFPGVDYAQTHNALGVVTICMPLGLTAFMLFQCLLKVPLVALLPTWVQQRMTPYSLPCLKPSFRFFLSVMVAVILGAYSHVIWDSFTHFGRRGTELIPLLSKEIFFAGQSWPVYKLAQHGSSLVGLPLLALLWIRHLHGNQPLKIDDLFRMQPEVKIAIWVIFLSLPLLVGLAYLFADYQASSKIYLAVTKSCAAFIVLAIVYSLLFSIFPKAFRDE